MQMTSLAVVLGLILAAVLTVVALGLPLLLRRDSPIPDMIGHVILAFLVLGFVWISRVWWMLPAIVGIAALVVWMDRGKAEPARQDTDRSDRTRLRLRLWLAAVCLMVVTVALLWGSLLTGIGLGSIMKLVVPTLLLLLVASQAFRLSYYRSCRRDADGAAQGTEPSSPHQGKAV